MHLFGHLIVSNLELTHEEKKMKEFFTKKEMASLLKVSLNTLNFWICRRKIPFIKLGTGKNAPVRFDKEEIQNWLKNIQRRNSNEKET